MMTQGDYKVHDGPYDTFQYFMGVGSKYNIWGNPIEPADSNTDSTSQDNIPENKA